MDEITKITLMKILGNIGIAAAISFAAVKLKKPSIMLLLPISTSSIRLYKKPIEKTEK